MFCQSTFGNVRVFHVNSTTQANINGIGDVSNPSLGLVFIAILETKSVAIFRPHLNNNGTCKVRRKGPFSGPVFRAHDFHFFLFPKHAGVIPGLFHCNPPDLVGYALPGHLRHLFIDAEAGVIYVWTGLSFAGEQVFFSRTSFKFIHLRVKSFPLASSVFCSLFFEPRTCYIDAQCSVVLETMISRIHVPSVVFRTTAGRFHGLCHFSAHIFQTVLFPRFFIRGETHRCRSMFSILLHLPLCGDGIWFLPSSCFLRLHPLLACVAMNHDLFC